MRMKTYTIRQAAEHIGVSVSTLTPMCSAA